MKEKGTYFVPTYTTVVDLAEPGGDYDVRSPARPQPLSLLHLHARPSVRAHKIGVKIVTGARSTGYGPESLTRISQ